MSPTYGHAYLTSYGWTGTGTGLRKGAIERPLAIPPKKNLSGLGKDRDEAFPFWDHLFAAASKAITIKVSSDDEDTDSEDPSDTDPKSAPLRRTTTGIISNRRPVSGTPVSTSGSATPSLDADVRLSLLATAKREAAKRGLYARFFRGPVLGPDDPSAGSPLHLARSSCESESESMSMSTPVPEHVGDRQDAAGETKKGKKRKSEDRAETREERRVRKRLKKERKAARAAKRAETGDRAKEKKDQPDRKARKHGDEETRSEENAYLKNARKRARKSMAGSAGEDLEQAKCTRKTEELASTNNGQQDTCSHRPPRNVDATDVVVTTKKKRKRKDTPS
ncbi:hypothetical protein OG21DRAFT_1496065 [Imleria badia]|nr:hypothetical protein OG21DRAFT_1496065 [Imleria badia]